MLEGWFEAAGLSASYPSLPERRSPASRNARSHLLYHRARLAVVDLEELASRERKRDRAVMPGWFKDAARYHTGGIAGLAPDEVPAILRRDEEVLTRADSRHRYNGGGNGSGETRVVNVFDSAAAIEAALQTPAGGRAILNFVQENPRAFKSAMGG